MAQTKLKPKRALAWLLTLCMVFGMLPMTAFAEEVESSVITAVEPLDELTATQYWGVGTEISELILPETLAATVTSGAALTVVTTEDVAVSAWQSEPAFDPNTLGTYIFTPTLDLPEGYSVADGLELPQITVAIFTPMGFAASATEVNAGDFTTLQSQIAAHATAADDTVITVTADITITSILYVPTNPAGKTLTIKGSASTIKLTRGAGATSDLISVGNASNNASKLILESITIDGGSGGAGALVYVNTGGTFTMNSDATLQNNARSSSNGGGVCNEGTFIMNGGKITNCTVTANYMSGGGVRNNGTFTMNNGEISGNVATSNGGGVSSNGTSFTMNGGTISDNTATGNSGGGVHINDGTFTMNGGTISGNMAKNSGGGVFYTGSQFRVSGSPIIENNKKDTGGNGTGGVYLDNSKTIVITGALNSGANIGIEGMGTTAAGTTIASSATNPVYAITEDDFSKFSISNSTSTIGSENTITLSGTVIVLGTYTAVTNITGVPTEATVGTNLTLTGTVEPSNAISKTITWSVKDAGGTGATISSNSLRNHSSAGTVVVTATISKGTNASTNYTQDFTITVNASPGSSAVAWSSLTANGESGTTTTTELTLTFDKDPTSLAASNITVTGATKGALSGTGTTRTLAISDITVANGENVTVTLTDPAGFTITPTSKTVAVNVAASGGGDANYTIYFRQADGSTGDYALYKGQTGTDKVDGENATWSVNGTTLTLTAFEFETTAKTALDLPAGTTITLPSGNSTIKTTSTDSSTIAINYTGSLKINGSGTLTADCAAVTSGYRAAIYGGPLTIEDSVTVNVISDSLYGVCVLNTFEMTGGTLNVTGGTTYGLGIGGGFSITGGTIYAKAPIAFFAKSISNAESITVKGIDGSNNYTVAGMFQNHSLYNYVATNGNIDSGLLTDVKITAAALPITLYYSTEDGNLHKDSTGGTVMESADGFVYSGGGTGNDTLTLNGFNFSTTATTALVMPDGTTIDLAAGSTNTITSIHNNPTGSDVDSHGINGNGALTIVGSGTLTVTGGVTAKACRGITVGGLLTINATGGTINAIGNSSVRASYGIVAGSLATVDGTVNATAATTTGSGSGSYGISATQGMNVSGGTVNATGSEIIATGTTANVGYSYGINISSNALTISGGVVTAIGGTLNSKGGGTSRGLNCASSPYLLPVITGGTFIATGSTRALSHDYTVPSGCKYFKNTAVTPDSTEITSTGDTTTDKIDSTHKYVKVVGPTGPTVTAPTFTGIKYGAAQPAAGNITIANASSSAVTINSVELSGTNASSFTIGGSGGSVPASGNIATWTVRPNENLAVGTHTATITVTYDTSKTVTATVSIVVSKATYGGTKTASGTVLTTGETGKTITLPALATGATYPASGTAANTGFITANSISNGVLTYTASAQPAATNTTVTITVTGGTNYENYNVVVTITAQDKTAQTIKFAGVTGGVVTKTVGNAAFTEAATLDGTGGTGAITYTSGTTATATVDSTSGLVTIVAAGTTVITATKAEDTTYAQATATYTLTVKPAPTKTDLTYTLTDTTYNKTAQSVTITPNTGVGAVTVKYNGNTTAPTNAGTYAITVDIADGASFGAATGIVIGDWTIAKAPITVTADAKDKLVGATDPVFTYNITVGTLFSDDTLTGSLSRVAGETKGNYAIVLGTLANANYAINFMGNYLTIKEQANDPVPTLYTVSGTITNTPGSGSVVVTIMQGNKVFGKSDGTSYSFANLAPGAYNITATNGTESKTVYVELTTTATVDITIDAKSAEVEVKGNDTPPVVIDVAAIQTDVDNGADSLKLIVDTTTVPTAIATIAAADGKTIAFNLDFSVVKNNTTPLSTYEFTNILTAQFPIPDVAKGKPITVYRLHGVTAAAMPVGVGNAIDGEYVEIDTDMITLHVKKFSDYAVGYTAPTKTITASAGTGGTISPSGTVTVNTGANQTFTITPNSNYSISSVTVDGVNQGAISTYTFSNVTTDHTITATFSYNGGGGGGGGTTYYNITIKKDGSGTGSVTSNHSSASYGSTVKITVKPDTGSALDKLTITRSNGDAISFKDNGDGTFTYTQPSSNVTVTATFKETIANSVVVTASINGSVTANQYSPETGGKVTITVKPDAGYELDKLTITDSNDKAVSFIDNKDGTFTFTQPNGKVTVLATFKSSDKPLEKPDDSDVSALLNTIDHMAYVSGVGNGMFSPNANMTRAEAAQMFYNLLLDKNVAITKNFVDVSDNAWYAKAVNTLASLGIISGYPDGGFHPGDNITRAQFATIVVRFGVIATGDTRFTDVPATHWAYDYINTAANFGWVTGVGDGKFAPDRNITRAEAVTLINRMLKRYPDKDYIDSHADLIHFADIDKKHWAYYEIMEAANAHDYKKDEKEENWK